VLKNRLSKKYSVILGALLTLGIAGFSALLSIYRPYLEERVIAEAGANNVRMKFTEFSPFFLGLQAENVTLFLPRYFIGLNLESPKFRLNLLSLLSMNLEGVFEANAYQGSVYAQMQRSLFSKNRRSVIKLNGLDLSANPQLSALGIGSGTLNVNAPAGIDLTGDLPQGDVSVELLNLKTLQAVTFPAKLLGLDLFIPPLDIPVLKVNLRLLEANLQINGELTTTQFGKGEIEGSAVLSKMRKLEQLDLRAKLRLSEQGASGLQLAQQFFAGKMEVVTDGQQNQRDWLLTIKGNAPYKIRLEALTDKVS